MRAHFYVLLMPLILGVQSLVVPKSRAVVGHTRACHADSSSAVSFDADLAVALGAHAFDTYNDPTVGLGKACLGEDSTLVTFQSSEPDTSMIRTTQRRAPNATRIG